MLPAALGVRVLLHTLLVHVAGCAHTSLADGAGQSAAVKHEKHVDVDAPLHKPPPPVQVLPAALGVRALHTLLVHVAGSAHTSAADGAGQSAAVKQEKHVDVAEPSHKPPPPVQVLPAALGVRVLHTLLVHVAGCAHTSAADGAGQSAAVKQ